MVVSPPPSRSSDDLFEQCEWALEDGVAALAGEAIKAGWSSIEINAALLRLALLRIMNAQDEGDTAAAVRYAWRGLGGSASPDHLRNLGEEGSASD
jgi:hypothetical protein